MNNEKIDKISKLLKLLSKEELSQLSRTISKKLGASEHFKWCVEWVVSKFDTNEVSPFEVIKFKENLVLDSGAEEVLKLIGGIAGAVPFSSANARIFVGSSEKAESPSQTGVLSPLGSASMEIGYPRVVGRNIELKVKFEEDEAIGVWKELSITNGEGSSAVALNRRVKLDMGEKGTGITIIVQATVSLLS